MQVAVYLPLVIPILAALAARPLADHLPPTAATWLFVTSSLALALASSMVLGLLALSALIRIPSVDAAGHLSRTAISGGDAVSIPVAIIAGGVLAAASVAACRALWRRCGAIAAAYRRARRLPGAGQIVVTEDAAADAYTLPGWPCRIVITQGMLRALSRQERDVLLAHERAHAAGAHYLFTSVARLAAAANPLLRPVAGQVGYTIERWADERAAAQAGDRPLTARAIAHAALATSAAPPDRDAAMTALGLILSQENDGPEKQHHGPQGSHGPHRNKKSRKGTHRSQAPHGSDRHRHRRRRVPRPGPVPRRVAALLAPPPRLSLLLLAAAILLVALSGACTLEAARNFHQLIEVAQGQPA